MSESEASYNFSADNGSDEDGDKYGFSRGDSYSSLDEWEGNRMGRRNKSSNEMRGSRNHDMIDSEALIKEETSKLEYFSESLVQCNKLTEKMTGVLDHLGHRLSTLQETLHPIRQATKDVAKAETNINKTMKELKTVVECYQLTTESLASIEAKNLKSINLPKKGRNMVNKHKKSSNKINNNKNDNLDEKRDGNELDLDLDLDEEDEDDDDEEDEDEEDDDDEDANDPFLNWIEKVNAANRYFMNNDFKSSEKAIEALKNIAKIAMHKMDKYFCDILAQQSASNRRNIDKIDKMVLPDFWYESENIFAPLWMNKSFVAKAKELEKERMKQANERKASSPGIGMNPIYNSYNGQGPESNGTDNDLRAVDDVVDMVQLKRMETTKLMLKGKEKELSLVTELIYMPNYLINILANVALHMESTGQIHGLNDQTAHHLSESRKFVLCTILKSMTYVKLVTIMYLTQKKPLIKLRLLEMKKQRLLNNVTTNSNNTTANNNNDDNGNETENEIENEADKHEHHSGMLSSGNMAKFNREQGIISDEENDGMMTVDDDSDKEDEVPTMTFDNSHHPIVLFVHLVLTFFILERDLCVRIMDFTQQNEKPILFDKFFASVIDEPLKMMIDKMNDILKIADCLEFARLAGKLNDPRITSYMNMKNKNSPHNMHLGAQMNGYDTLVMACQQAATSTVESGSLTKFILLVKLDLLRTWHKLYLGYDKVLNGSQEFGDNYHDLLRSRDYDDGGDSDDGNDLKLDTRHGRRGHNDKKKKGQDLNDLLSPMELMKSFGLSMYQNVWQTIEMRIDLTSNHDVKDIRNDGGYHALTIETCQIMRGLCQYHDTINKLAVDVDVDVNAGNAKGMGNKGVGSGTASVSVNSLNSNGMNNNIKNNKNDSNNNKNNNKAKGRNKKKVNFALAPNGNNSDNEEQDSMIMSGTDGGVRSALEDVLSRMCEGLISNLIKKGAQYPKNRKTLECIFMINNLHYIRKSIEKDSFFEQLMKSQYQSILRQIVSWKNKYISATWNQLLKEITVKEEGANVKQDGLNKKERKGIKKKFKTFNILFNEQLNSQKMFSVPDSILRQELRNMHSSYVLGPYRVFLKTYKDSDFSKNKGEYFKYDDQKIEKLLNQFFIQK